MKMHTRFVKMLPALVALAVAAGCSRGPELIDRTQPNYVKKSDLLDGTWYIRDTVVGVPPTSAVTFEGYQGDVDKVRFEVQEQYLVAYRTYEWFPGSDARVDSEKSTIGNVVTVDGKPYRGAPVGAWRITGHFDRIREYNPATGEQSNVLTENYTDRPWYERDFMRVDWGRNVVTNYNMLGPISLAGWGGRPGEFNTWVQPMDQEPGDDALVMDYSEQNGTKRLDYFDFTVRQYWDAPTYNYPGYGEIPYCWLAPTMDCRGAVIKVRTSLMKVDEARVADYEPLKYDDKMQKKFGLFRNGWGHYGEGPTYDRNHGATLTGRLMMAKRHNIWKRAKDESGATIPVTERQPRPVVYHLSENYPKDLMESAKQIESSWDGAFRKAVAVPRGLEVSQIPQMFYLCENPVKEGAPAACGKPCTLVRPGDLRYNLFNWVDHPQMAGPLGYGPSGSDPETGEIIQGVANMYGAGVDTFAGSTLQLLDVLTGDLSIDDLIAGNDVRSFLADNRKPADPRKDNGPAQSQSGLVSDETQKQGSFSRLEGALKSRMITQHNQKGLPKAVTNKRAVGAALISQNPLLEDELVNLPEVRAAVLAAAPGEIWRQKLMTDPSFYRQVAREQMLRMDELIKLDEQRQFVAGVNNLWLAEFSDGAYISLAKELKAFYEGKRAGYEAEGLSAVAARAKAKTDAWTKLRNMINRFVAEHEVGHTIGLTHNFIGSYDAMNFRDEYWDLRKDTIGVIAGGQRVLPTTPADLMEAARRTEKQLDSNMQSYEYSTVMDYMARFPIHAHGVGKYDEAAILFAYSGGPEVGWVEVFNETRADTEGPAAWSDPTVKVPTTNMAKPMRVRGAHAEIPLAHVEHYTPLSTMYTDRYHYTTLPFHFADKNLIMGGQFEKALDQGIERMKNRSYRKYSELENTYKAIQVALKESNLNQDNNLLLRMYDRSPEDYQRAAAIVEFATRGKPVEVPYMYCSDYERGANMACNLWDSGADVYEMTRDWINRYNEYYAFSNFRRDRLNFSPQGVFRSKYGRFLASLPNIYQQWLFNVYWYQDGYDMTTEQMHEWFGGPDPIYQNYWTMAVMDGVNHLTAELSQPSAGYYGKDAATGRWTHLTQNNTQNTRFNTTDEQNLRDALTSGATAPFTEVVYVPRGPGRSMYTLFDNQGYDFWRRTNEVGHFWDQYGALLALTETDSQFIGVDRGADATRYSLPYSMTFDKELADLFAGVWLQDGARFSSGLIRNGDGTAKIQLPNLIRAEKFVSGFQYPVRHEAPPVDGDPMVNEPVEPTPPWTTRFQTLVNGMISFTALYDIEFADQYKVYRLGSSENLTPAPGFEPVVFADPFGGGYSYAALKRTVGEQNSAAVFEIERAIQLKADWDYKKAQAANTQLPASERAYWAAQAAEYEGKTRETVRSLEIMRGLYNIFGRAW